MAMVAWQNADNTILPGRLLDLPLSRPGEEKEPLHPGRHNHRIHYGNTTRSPANEARPRVTPAAQDQPRLEHARPHRTTELKRDTPTPPTSRKVGQVDHATLIRDRVMPSRSPPTSHNNQVLANSLSPRRPGQEPSRSPGTVGSPRPPEERAPTTRLPQRSGDSEGEDPDRYELGTKHDRATNSGALDWKKSNPEQVERRAIPYGLATRQVDYGKLAEQIAALSRQAGCPRRPDRRPAANAAGKAAPARTRTPGRMPPSVADSKVRRVARGRP